VILYHLDEHVPRAIADGLRRRGIDASTTVEAGLRSATDEAHLAYARAQGRVMVTCDRDFLVLASRGQLHAGIVYYPYGRYPVGEVIRQLVRLWEQHSAEDMLNRVEFL
jgi:predicted nuclease of predicted toxin-antitoxin system